MKKRWAPGVTRQKPWACVACGYRMDAASIAFHNKQATDQPEPGDLCLCMNCGARYMLDDDGRRWRPLTAAEFAGLDAELRRQLTLGQSVIGRLDFPDLAERQRRRRRGQT